jgi:hypothetical protein
MHVKQPDKYHKYHNIQIFTSEFTHEYVITRNVGSSDKY